MSIPINKSLDDVRNDLFAKISVAQQEGQLPVDLNLNRGPVRGMIELWAWGLYQLYQLKIEVLKQAFPGMAGGKWLELHCDQVNVSRLQAKKCQGHIHFVREDASGNVPIPAGRVVKTLPDGSGKVHRFVTVEDAVLADGQSEVAVAVESEQYGRSANVTVGAIKEVATTIPGVDGVENRADWIAAEGADVEGDAELQERYSLAWSATNGATKYAYESWARSVTGVIAAKIIDDHPRGQGSVDVVIKGTAGIPTPELIAGVDAVVSANKPINDDVLVKGPTAVLVGIDVELIITHGDEAVIAVAAEKRLRALFEDPTTVAGITPLQIGEDLPLDRMVAAVMAVDGVKQLNWTSPAADVAVGGDELAVLDSITLAVSQVVEV